MDVPIPGEWTYSRPLPVSVAASSAPTNLAVRVGCSGLAADSWRGGHKHQSMARNPRGYRQSRGRRHRDSAVVCAVISIGAARHSRKHTYRRGWLRARERPSVVALRAVDSEAGPSGDELDFLVQVLREINQLVVLQAVDDQPLAEFASEMKKVSYQPGDVIIRQGDKVDKMFIVSEGSVEEQRQVADSEEPFTLVSSRGASFGAATLLGKTPQTKTVVAKESCSLWVMDRALFDSLLAKLELVADEPDAEDDDDEDSDEDDDEACSVSDVREIFVVSDGTGESAKQSMVRAMRQFEYCFERTCGSARTTVFRFLRTPEEAKAIAKKAATMDALVVYTVMDRAVNETFAKALQEEGVQNCDLWAGLLDSLESKFGAKPSGVTVRRQLVSDEYMQIVKAIEYTRKVDDGVLPNMWSDADIMLIGPSRAGKTPLAFYLAQRGYKVANYPVVPDEEPPKELFQIDQSKCFALIIQPEKLRDIRVERMAQFGRKNTQYASMDNIKKEVRWIQTFYMRKGPSWPVIDTSNAGVVETAARILEVLDRRKGNALAASFMISGMVT